MSEVSLITANFLMEKVSAKRMANYAIPLSIILYHLSFIKKRLNGPKQYRLKRDMGFTE
jgi:hypothetical protein